jgi:thioredoxin 1
LKQHGFVADAAFLQENLDEVEKIAMATPTINPETLRREDLANLAGPVLLEFGSADCSVCRSYRPEVTELLDRFEQVRHIAIEDGPGKPLGRSFQVKLWPTFVFLRDGDVLQRSVRPGIEEIEVGLQAITAGEDSTRS